MATRMTSPETHNWTSKRFSRTLAHPSDYDPFLQPHEDDGYSFKDYLLLGVGMFLASSGIAFVFVAVGGTL